VLEFDEADLLKLDAHHHLEGGGDTCVKGEKRVDVAELYDSDSYRPIIRTVRGKPMYLY
jgi:hypothetical protein